MEVRRGREREKREGGEGGRRERGGGSLLVFDLCHRPEFHLAAGSRGRGGGGGGGGERRGGGRAIQRLAGRRGERESEGGGDGGGERKERRKRVSSGSVSTPGSLWRTESEQCYTVGMEEGRKRVLLIAASILAARKLAQYDSGARVPATVAAIADGVRWAERIMEEIDRRHPSVTGSPSGSREHERC